MTMTMMIDDGCPYGEGRVVGTCIKVKEMSSNFSHIPQIFNINVFRYYLSHYS